MNVLGKFWVTSGLFLSSLFSPYFSNFSYILYFSYLTKFTYISNFSYFSNFTLSTYFFYVSNISSAAIEISLEVSFDLVMPQKAVL